jgi:hypothetical protein
VNVPILIRYLVLPYVVLHIRKYSEGILRRLLSEDVIQIGIIISFIIVIPTVRSLGNEACYAVKS